MLAFWLKYHKLVRFQCLGYLFSVRLVLFLVLFHTDMYHAKLKMKTYLLTTVLDSKGILSECKAKMRELLQSVETYRSQYRPLNEKEDLNTTILADWPSSARTIMSFIETTV